MNRSPMDLCLAIALALAAGCSKTPCGDTSCSSSEVCVWALWSCGDSDAIEPAGHCVPRPSSCPAEDQPVCGCDGKIHANACEALKDGADLSAYSSVTCAAPGGRFECGYAFCESGEEWCREEFEVGWSCEPIPDACKQSGADCACLMDKAPDCYECYEAGSDFELSCGGGA
jgi:hypothetical protein